ncbi:hypothetical protein NOF55_11465 [Rhizobiaceae bacterium BDR2-2]|uniref:Uncharacterized protein n=1 Tax=Ectorhizobium quercum TaxID=2965071 RepID=A0AAE3SW77_9HYPH|nr:hypothetical protein [Ectorhizobium quercum]MCX8997719.1 hypothetical protein [Ectorhizobium quercum]
MQAAVILMTIMGCDDAATMCHYVATPEQRWPTIALCEAASEEQLSAYANRSNYPVLIAACQVPAETVAEAPPAEPQTQAADESATTAVNERVGLTRKAIERARGLLPSADGMKELAAKPVHVVSDGYDWVVSVFRK